MAKRLIVGPILIVLVFGLMWLDEWLTTLEPPAWLGVLALKDGKTAPGVALLLVGLLICARASIELARMYQAAGMAASRRVVVFAAMVGVLAGGLTIGSPTRSLGGMQGTAGGGGAGAALATAAVLVVAVALLVHTRRKTITGACGAVGAALTAFAYAGVTLGFLMALRTQFSAWVVLGVIMTAKCCDIGAYFTGRAIGRHKLIPWVSPGKTWEGLVGGMLTAGAVGAGLVAFAQSLGQGAVEGIERLTTVEGFVAGVVLGLAAQIGDLSASVLKRDAGIKDSGRLVPGMGGIIDVIDSLVLAGPAAFWYFSLLRSLGSLGPVAPAASVP
ncbi:MAG: phosphatidate cytidylyltransferase [Phycisphaerales bacterium]